MQAMHITPSTIAALIISGSFAAGLNIYATILTLGLLSHTGWAALPQGLDILGSWWIIGVSAIMFGVEFVADKIPGFDLFWNALHTFIRVPAAALIAYRASMHLSPELQLLATVGGAAIAMAAHSSKTAMRLAVTPSPEPISNIALSTSEDAAAIGLSWMATLHPWVAWTGAGIAILCITLALFASRWLIRRLKSGWVKLTSAAA